MRVGLYHNAFPKKNTYTKQLIDFNELFIAEIARNQADMNYCVAYANTNTCQFQQKLNAKPYQIVIRERGEKF